MLKQVMRPQTLALLALTGLALSYAGGARAENTEAWCANYTDRSQNCGFSTLAQCEADISGVGGMCVLAPMQVEVKTIMTPRGPRRLIRDAID